MFANSRMALAVYDSTQARRDAALDSARTAAEMAAWTCNEAEALRAVRLAFYEDTKEFNSLAHCMMARLSFIRDCVQAS
jgi:hypothetical protein